MPLITHPALNLGPLLARQQNAIEMAFCWWADSGLFFGGGPLAARFSIVGRYRPVFRWRADYYNIITIPPYPKRHKFLCVSNVIKNAIKTHPALNLGPLLARQPNVIDMAFCWWADSGPCFSGGPLIARFSMVGR